MEEWPSLASISLKPGTRHCLHVPGNQNAEAVGLRVARLFPNDAVPLQVAMLPKPQFWMRRLFRAPTPASWLASRTGLSLEDCLEISSSLPIPMPDRFDCMAYNPLRFLAFLSALYPQPKVLVYETDGMDPSGAMALHQYAALQYSGVLIHCRWYGGGLQCELKTECKAIRMVTNCTERKT